MEPQQTQPPQYTPNPTSQIPLAGGDTYSYRGWLNSDAFYKRALAICGYAVIGQLLLSVPFIIIVMVLGSLAS